MVLIESCWHTRGSVVIRGVLVIAALSAALLAGMLVFSKHGQSKTPPAPCTAAGCSSNDSLPGGWPVDPNQSP
jgi:hypothetical protein